MVKRLLLILALHPPLVGAQIIFQKQRSPRIANYDIKAAWVQEEKTIKASWTLHWFNKTDQPATELRFHLYLNAFKNEKSTFFRESGGSHRGSGNRVGKNDWGFCEIEKLRIKGGADLTDSIKFLSPDDGNADDQTVMSVKLPTAIAPGGDITIECEFYSKLPRAFARTGFTGDDFFLAGQWFPKIGVWNDGTWFCHQFHSLSEFFADFGVYTMELTVPARWVVGANGVLLKKESTDSTATYFFRQEDVTDAVWTASPNFTEIKQEVRIRDRVISVTYFFSPGREVQKDQYFAIVDSVLNYCDQWYGPYPYPNLTIVDPPVGEEMTVGGMEYPTLFTTGGFFRSKFVTDFLGLHWLEVVTFHEFAHNYFQGMVASNEALEPWLDEGFTSYTEHRALERYFGTRNGYGDVLGMPYSSLNYHRMSYISNPRAGIMTAKSWQIPPNFYQTAGYSKPVLVLSTLERYLGRAAMDSVMRAYFARWSFNHPRTEDFLDVVQEVSGRDLAWFIEQYVKGDQTVDLKVSRITNKILAPDAGWFDEAGGMRFAENKESGEDSSGYHSTVRLNNDGTGIFPTTVVFYFAGGDTAIKSWDGSSGQVSFEFFNRPKILRVVIDPERENLLDLNLHNNSLSVEQETAGIGRYTIRFFFWVETLLQFIMSLF